MQHFEFDPGESRLNEQRHGVDFDRAQALWDEPHVIIPARHVVGEARYLILAEIDGKCYAAVFTRRAEAIRLISCHRADRRLERIYESRLKGQKDA